MSKAREKRLREARKWYEEQGFNDDSHIVKAYRKRFNVDNNCAMKELCMLNVLSPEKQKAYEDILKAKAAKKRKKKQPEPEYDDLFQDDTFYFIAGYTSGGAPYGMTWDEAEEKGLCILE